MSNDKRDTRAKEIIDGYTWGAGAAMLAIPVPGADMAATYAVWAKMICDIAPVYGFSASLDDAKHLAGDLFKGAVLTSVAWFASAKTASAILKFIPGAGTVTAYVLDAAIAALGAKKITAGVGVAAAAYYKSGKTLAPKDLAGHVKKVLGDPSLVLRCLAAVAPAVAVGDEDIA